MIDNVTSDAIVPVRAHRVTSQIEIDRSNDGQEIVRPGKQDNHHRSEINMKVDVIQVEIVQIVTMIAIAVGQDPQNETQIVDIHDHGPGVVHKQNEQIIQNQLIILD